MFSRTPRKPNEVLRKPTDYSLPPRDSKSHPLAIDSFLSLANADFSESYAPPRTANGERKEYALYILHVVYERLVTAVKYSKLPAAPIAVHSEQVL